MLPAYSYLDVSDTILRHARGEVVTLNHRTQVVLDTDRVQPRSIKAVKRLYKLQLPERATIRELSNA